MKLLRAILFCSIAALLTSCAHFTPPMEQSFKPEESAAVVYGRFEINTEFMGTQISLRLLNESSRKEQLIRFQLKDPVYCIPVEPGSYRIVGFVATDITHWVVGRRTLSNSPPFNVQQNSATYIGNFTGITAMKGLILRWEVKAVTNSFTETTKAFHEKYPSLAAIPITSLFDSEPSIAIESNTVHVALVFDDGPFPEHTPKLCELFAKEKVHVSFSFVGTNVQTHPDTAKSVLAGGHEINNHSYSHRHAKDLDDATLEYEIVGAQKIITEKTGVAPKWYWCPFLESDDRIRATAAKAGIEVYSLKQVVVSQDYDRAVSAEDIKRKATTNVKDGSVILFHEWRNETYEQMPAILAELRKQGCVFMTFSELAAYVGKK